MPTVYLSPTGSDSYTYAQAQNPATPWQTFSKVNSSAASGDIVMCAAGTYTLDNITWTKSFTIFGASLSNERPTTIVRADGTVKRWGLSGITLNLRNLGFQNFKLGNWSSGSGILYGVANNSVLSAYRCEFISNVESGLGAYSVLIGNGFMGTRYSMAHTLVRCTFYIDDPNFYALIEQYSSPSASSTTFHNNTVYLRRCLTDTSILYFYNGTYTVNARNNIVHNASGVTVRFGYSDAATLTQNISHNCLFQTNVGTGFSNPNGITSNPKFADPLNFKFRLAPDSPCIGAGTVV